MEKYEALAKQLETAYEQFRLLIQNIDQLQTTLNKIENASNTVLSKYRKALDPEKLKNIEETTKTEYKKMQDKIEQLNTLVNDAELMHQYTHEVINQSLKRVEKFGSGMSKAKQISQDVDKKLTILIQTAEKNKEDGERHFIKASTLFDANREIEKYDELLKLERENNRMLKDLLKVMKPLSDVSLDTMGLPLNKESVSQREKNKKDSNGVKPRQNR